MCDTLYVCDVLYYMYTYRDRGQPSGQLSHFTLNPGDQREAIELGSKYLYLLSQLITPVNILKKKSLRLSRHGDTHL